MSDNNEGQQGTGEGDPQQHPYGAPYVPPQDPLAAPSDPNAYSAPDSSAPAAGAGNTDAQNQSGTPATPPYGSSDGSAYTPPAGNPYAPPAGSGYVPPTNDSYASTAGTVAGAPQFGAPQSGSVPPHGAAPTMPGSGTAQYPSAGYGAPQYGTPQAGSVPPYGAGPTPPAYGDSSYGAPQYGAPQPPAQGYGAYTPPVKQSNVLAILALVFGIAAVVFSFFAVLGILFGIAGIVLGILAKTKKQSAGMSLTGIITGAVGIVLSILIAVVLNFWITNLGSEVVRSLEESTSGVESTAEPFVGDGGTHTVEVKATVDSGTATVDYGADGEQDSESFSGTFTETFDVEDLSFVAVTVTPDSDVLSDVEVTCEITVDGEQVDTNTSTLLAICSTTTIG